jgi:hypothetical protein
MFVGEVCDVEKEVGIGEFRYVKLTTPLPEELNPCVCDTFEMETGSV